jgi:hypothetical protein
VVVSSFVIVVFVSLVPFVLILRILGVVSFVVFNVAPFIFVVVFIVVVTSLFVLISCFFVVVAILFFFVALLFLIIVAFSS